MKKAYLSLALIGLCPLPAAAEIKEAQTMVRSIATGAEILRQGLYEIIVPDTETIIYILNKSGQPTQMEIVPFSAANKKQGEK